MAIKRPMSLLTIQIWTRSNTLVHYLGLSPKPSSFANTKSEQLSVDTHEYLGL